MIKNRIYEHQNLLSLAFSFLVGLRTYQHPCIKTDNFNYSFIADHTYFTSTTAVILRSPHGLHSCNRSLKKCKMLLKIRDLLFKEMLLLLLCKTHNRW